MWIYGRLQSISPGLEGILWKNLNKSTWHRWGHTLESSPRGTVCLRQTRTTSCITGRATLSRIAKKGRAVGILSKRRATKGSSFSRVYDTRVEFIYKENIYFMWSCFSAIHLPSEDWEQFDCCISNTSSTVISPLLSTPICFPFPTLKWLVYSLKLKPADKDKNKNLIIGPISFEKRADSQACSMLNKRNKNTYMMKLVYSSGFDPKVDHAICIF